ncbi:hypothetical protein CHS0354_007404 [Potamilus streckersoni]|uniref:Glucosamine 6-phosphate N-acetyltransferase n=1 Tax=Potamilus streckersoni TaxID=2493646 RepID=A0AAE0SRY6_9BIVA|nr:hypothetical protein CHS0354_007404 [Potamilus streckersoni]
MEPGQNGNENKPIFDHTVLYNLDFSKSTTQYNPAVSVKDPGEGLCMRPLCRGDYDKGYMSLLSQMTKVGDVSREEFEARFSAMESCPDSYYIVVIEDVMTKKVIGSGTLVIEQKFIRKCSSRGRIEDVVVHNQYRGRQLVKLLMDTLMVLSYQLGCYKVSLESEDDRLIFYSQFGLIKEEGQNYMCRRFKEM